jgi:lipopolysaccharide transport system permease protein
VFASLYRYRSFIWQHALADLRHRYAGTGMGWVWNVLHPLAMIAVYALIFGSIFSRDMAGVPGRWGLTVYLCVGFFPWIAFSDCINRGAYALSGNAAYLKKLPVPEQVFVAETVVAASITLVFSLTLFMLISLALGVRPTWYWLLLPVPIILLQSIGFGFGLIVGTLNVFFTDIAQFLGIILQVLFWLTPIVYLPSQVPRLERALNFTPATPAMLAIHNLFLFGKPPETWMILAMLAWAIGAITIGSLLLNRLRGEIRDVL